MPNSNEMLIVYGTEWCPDCIRTRRFLKSQGTAYRWVDIAQDREGALYVERVNRGYRSVSTIVFPDGTILVEPSDAELGRHLQRVHLR